MLVNGIIPETMEEMVQLVEIEGFKTIVIEECAELQKAICKDIRDYKSAIDFEDLLDTLADNLLATQYLISSLNLEEQVLEVIKKKHSRNYNNAKNGVFLHRDRLPNIEDITIELSSNYKNGSSFYVKTLTSDKDFIFEKINEKFVVKIVSYSCSSNEIVFNDVFMKLENSFDSEENIINETTSLLRKFKYYY